MDDRADHRLSGDDVLTCRRDRTLKSGESVVVLELDTETYCSRWSVAVAASIACDVSINVRIGETCNAEPYEVKLLTTLTAAQNNKLIDAAWINTGLARRIRVVVSHNGGADAVINAKVIADRQAGTAIGVTVLPGTQVVV